MDTETANKRHVTDSAGNVASERVALEDDTSVDGRPEKVASDSPVEEAPKIATKFIGHVFEVKNSAPRFLIEVESFRTEIGAIEVGAYVLVQFESLAVLAQISELEDDPSKQYRLNGRLQLLATINLDTCELIPGLTRIPTIGSKVFMMSQSLVQEFFEPRRDGRVPLIHLANLEDAAGASIYFTPDILYSRHCAVLGSTGGGKSHTVARLLEETLKLRSKTIVFDPTGEYGVFKSKYIKNVHLGKLDVPPSVSKEVAVPYYHLTESDLMGIFRPQGQSQAPKLRAAMKSLKLSILSPSVALEGYVIKSDRDKRHFMEEYARHIKAIDNPLAIFDLNKLPQQIENECVRPTRSAVEPYFWGGVNQVELAYCTPLVVRISDIISLEELACIFSPGKLASLLDEVEEFLADPSYRMLRISLERLPFLHNAREIVSNAIARQLMMLARQGRFKKNPVVVFVDEAHQFLKDHLENSSDAVTIDSMALIAKEGRKYGVSLCIATQRPRDIPESILSQVGTFIVHRLSNINDRAIIESATANADAGSLSILPLLAPGACLIMGVAVPFTLKAQVVHPDNPPESETPSLNDYWRI